MNNSENICIQFDCDTDSDVDLQKLEALIQNICVEFNVLDIDVQISIVNDAGIIEVHHQFLDKNTTTDVISFDLSDEFETARSFQIIVNADMAHRQATKRGHTRDAELALYITHGMLHQLGYDDLEPQQARLMHEKEDAILQNNGFGIIYHKQETKE